MRAATFLTLILSAACAGSPADDEIVTEGLLSHSASGKADGVSSEEYFAQFVYAEVPEAGYYDSGQPRRTLNAGTQSRGELWVESADEGSLYVDISLWMLEDGRAYLEYAELKQGSSYDTWINDRIVLTRWRVTDDQLVVDGVGFAVPSERNGYPTMTFTFTDDVVTPGAAEGSVTVHRIRTSSYIGHVERDYADQEGF